MMASKRNIQTEQYRWQRHHPALIVGDRLRAHARRADPMLPHFEQSPVASECGAMGVASALVILGLAKSHALTMASTRKSGVPYVFFQAFRETWFEGCDHQDMVRRILMMKLPVSLGFRFLGAVDLESFAMMNLARGELVMLAFRSVQHGKTNHWALGLGAEGVAIDGRHIVDTLLLLDSSAPDPQYRVWNARLRMNDGGVSHVNLVNKTSSKRSKPITWWYESSQWAPELVRLEAAVRIKRND
ncbi:hypothetical protein [Variovorax sp. PCZ-1]|uniref:hypothetical protein n=1 Tax=Variovorax sp. PCZ-1 TaxID=2835533 RepID=UPI001BCACA4B|nr:hypothetical protein [Variovorax sp. PCZ-1]MBS7809231.1 hypothetical protein [Variovorax sp. PCZ-1]